MSQLNKLLLSIAVLFCIKGNAQFYLGTADSVFSNEYKENRNFLVYLPNEVRDKKDSAARYPVLYVLDGGSHYLSVAGMVKELSEFAGDMMIPKMIVVCIPPYNRTNELTPYPIAKNKQMPYMS